MKNILIIIFLFGLSQKSVAQQGIDSTSKKNPVCASDSVCNMFGCVCDTDFIESSSQNDLSEAELGKQADAEMDLDNIF